MSQHQNNTEIRVNFRQEFRKQMKRRFWY